MPDRLRLFFALWPDPAVRAAVAQSAVAAVAASGLRGHRVPEERLHLTLLFLGDLDPVHLGPATAAAAGLRAAPFTLRLERVGCFNAARVLWIGPRRAPEALTDLWLRLREAVDAAGVPHERRALAPHVTCLRRLDRTLKTAPMAPIEWAVADFVLAHSLSHPRPEYRVLERFELRDAQPTRPVKSGESRAAGE